MIAATSLLLTINVPPALEERVVDWLLAGDPDRGFTSYPAFGHGSRHEHLSVAEQVSGRQRRLEFRVEADGPAVDDLLADLESEFAGADVYYVVSPIVRSGHLVQR